MSEDDLRVSRQLARAAEEAVNDPDVMVYLGTFNSGAARASIPILCQANLVMISPANTYPGLTRQLPHNQPNEPDVYYPDCPQNYARVAATDDYQGANAAATARRIGLQVVAGPEATGGDYRALADKIRLSSVDLVYWGGLGRLKTDAGELWQALRRTLGKDVPLMGGDGINSSAFVNAVGWAAEDTFATYPGVPAAKLTGKGAEWYQRYKQTYQGEPDPYAAYAYEAMNVALAAIERVGKKDRAAIRDAVFGTRDYDGILGTWSFTPTGDTTLTMMAVSQVRNGRWDDHTVQVIETAP